LPFNGPCNCPPPPAAARQAQDGSHLCDLSPHSVDDISRWVIAEVVHALLQHRTELVIIRIGCGLNSSSRRSSDKFMSRKVTPEASSVTRGPYHACRICPLCSLFGTGVSAAVQPHQMTNLTHSTCWFRVNWWRCSRTMQDTAAAVAWANANARELSPL
jgi:hypothetical protein